MSDLNCNFSMSLDFIFEVHSSCFNFVWGPIADNAIIRFGFLLALKVVVVYILNFSRILLRIKCFVLR